MEGQNQISLKVYSLAIKSTYVRKTEAQTGRDLCQGCMQLYMYLCYKDGNESPLHSYSSMRYTTHLKLNSYL